MYYIILIMKELEKFDKRIDKINDEAEAFLINEIFKTFKKIKVFYPDAKEIWYSMGRIIIDGTVTLPYYDGDNGWETTTIELDNFVTDYFDGGEFLGDLDEPITDDDGTIDFNPIKTKLKPLIRLNELFQEYEQRNFGYLDFLNENGVCVIELEVIKKYKIPLLEPKKPISRYDDLSISKEEYITHINNSKTISEDNKKNILDTIEGSYHGREYIK